jgi:hypothetical protein
MQMKGMMNMSIFLTSLRSALGSMTTAGTRRSAKIFNPISPLTVLYFWISFTSPWKSDDEASTYVWVGLSWMEVMASDSMGLKKLIEVTRVSAVWNHADTGISSGLSCSDDLKIDRINELRARTLIIPQQDGPDPFSLGTGGAIIPYLERKQTIDSPESLRNCSLLQRPVIN